MRAIGAIVALALAAPVWALTDAQLHAGAKRATAQLRAVTRRLASDALAGRDNDTPGSTAAQNLIIRRLKRLGRPLDPTRRGPDAYRQPFVAEGQEGTNLLAVIRGRELPDEYVIVGAHYDHVGTRSAPDGSCRSGGDPGGAVCNGATDNAAGTAAVLAVGRALRRLPTPPRRSVVLALWDMEEDGLLGSAHYVANPMVPLARTVAYVNLDILGSDMTPSLSPVTFAVGSETGGETLTGLVTAAAAAEAAIDVRRVSFIFGQLRSDYANFVAAEIPTVFFSDSESACYHTTGDDAVLVDLPKLRAQSRVVYRVVATLAEAATVPAFVPPNPGFATYEDAVSLRAVFARGVEDVTLFPADDQVILRALEAELIAIVAEGPDAFDADDVSRVLTAAVQGIATLKHLGCLRR